MGLRILCDFGAWVRVKNIFIIKKFFNIFFIKIEGQNSRKFGILRSHNRNFKFLTPKKYSPCGRRLAVASRSGSCYVLANQDVENSVNFNFLVEMNSYFGGFLCCSWSPSGQFLAAGGEPGFKNYISEL